jgi:hypothetical protein
LSMLPRNLIYLKTPICPWQMGDPIHLFSSLMLCSIPWSELL